MIYHMSGGGGAPVVPTPSLTIDWDTGLVTSTATCKRGRVVSDTTRYSSIQLQTQGAATINPGTQRVTAVPTNRLVNGNVYVAGDSNLVSENIISGKSIFGVPGSAFSVSKSENKVFSFQNMQPIYTSSLGWQDSFFVGAKIVLIDNLFSNGSGSGGNCFVRTCLVMSDRSMSTYNSIGSTDTLTSVGANYGGMFYLDSTTGTIRNTTQLTYFLVSGAYSVTKWY